MRRLAAAGATATVGLSPMNAPRPPGDGREKPANRERAGLKATATGWRQRARPRTTKWSRMKSSLAKCTTGTVCRIFRARRSGGGMCLRR